LVFSKKSSVSWKTVLSFLKRVKGSKSVLECNQICKISQNVQKIVAFLRKVGFFEKPEKFSKMAKGSKFSVECY